MKSKSTKKNSSRSKRKAYLVVRKVDAKFFTPKEREKIKSKKKLEYSKRSYLPMHNRYFCNAIGRVKMLFKSETEAKLFLLYNSAEYEAQGRVPCRAYRCNCCDGWHLTHLELLPMRSMMREMKIIEQHIKKNGKYIA